MTTVSAKPRGNADPSFSLKGRRVFVAGHKGMVGSAIVRRLSSEDCELVTADRETANFTRQSEAESCIAAIKPDVVVIAAAKVGGIFANNSLPVDLPHDNLTIALN